MISRRRLLQSSAALATFGAVPLSLPGVSFAAAPTDNRLVLIILRGGLDGLSAVPPYADPGYGRLRGGLAVPMSGEGAGQKLDGSFALHPSLATLHAWVKDGAASVLPAVATPYRERSHFDGQDVLESGGAAVKDRKDGWLNRALSAYGQDGEDAAIAVAQAMPLVLFGGNRASTWYPSNLPEPDEDYLERVRRLYQNDERLREAYDQARRTREQAEGNMAGMTGYGGQAFANLTAPAGRFLAAADGPRIAVLESGGWDTHANQGTNGGRLARLLGDLDAGLAALKDNLGDAWSKTAVVMVTEFGRTMALNGSGGTDHGTGGAGFVMGGAIKGGSILGDWPGLAQSALYEGRDLKPTLDMRALFKAVLISHLGLDQAFVDKRIFPGSARVKPLDGLFG